MPCSGWGSNGDSIVCRRERNIVRSDYMRVSNQGWADPTHTNTDTYDRNATYTEHLNMIIRLHITVIATIAL